MLLTVVAVFGTTISPYLFFWQAAQEVEESNLSHRRNLKDSGLSKGAFRHIALDTDERHADLQHGGVLHHRDDRGDAACPRATTIQTAAQAAEALRPIAGVLTFFLFAAGIIGTGLLAVPVLAGSAAYAVAETFGISGSLELPASRAIGFYAIVSAATLAGAGLTLTAIDPIAMLFWTAVINGVVAVPIMIVMMLVVVAPHARESMALPRWLIVLGWLAAALMAVAVALLLWSSLR